jgi:hypothetical protein
MTGKRLLVHTLFLLLLPIIVAWLGISVSGAIGAVSPRAVVKVRRSSLIYR